MTTTTNNVLFERIAARKAEYAAKESRKLHRDMLVGMMDQEPETIIEALQNASNGGYLHSDVLVNELSELFSAMNVDLFVDVKSKQSTEDQFAAFVLAYAKDLAARRGRRDCVANQVDFDRFAKIESIQLHLAEGKGVALKLHKGDSLRDRIAMRLF